MATLTLKTWRCGGSIGIWSADDSTFVGPDGCRSRVLIVLGRDWFQDDQAKKRADQYTGQDDGDGEIASHGFGSSRHGHKKIRPMPSAQAATGIEGIQTQR